MLATITISNTIIGLSKIEVSDLMYKPLSHQVHFGAIIKTFKCIYKNPSSTGYLPTTTTQSIDIILAPVITYLTQGYGISIVTTASKATVNPTSEYDESHMRAAEQLVSQTRTDWNVFSCIHIIGKESYVIHYGHG